MIRETCAKCSGRGWLPPALGCEWATECKACIGTGSSPSIYRLAKAINENRSTLYRLRDVRVNGETAARLLGKLCALVGAAIVAAACSFEDVAAPASDVAIDLECRPAAGEPNCNGARRRGECRAAGLPDAYGLDAGCAHPVYPDGSACRLRWQGAYRCVERGDLLCCPGPGGGA